MIIETPTEKIQKLKEENRIITKKLVSKSILLTSADKRNELEKNEKYLVDFCEIIQQRRDKKTGE